MFYFYCEDKEGLCENNDGFVSFCEKCQYSKCSENRFLADFASGKIVDALQGQLRPIRSCNIIKTKTTKKHPALNSKKRKEKK